MRKAPGVTVAAKLPAALVTKIDQETFDRQIQAGPRVRVTRSAVLRDLLQAGLEASAPAPVAVRKVRSRKPYREPQHA